MLVFPIEFPGIIRTGHFTIAAADAAIIIHHHQTICAVIGGFYRADFHTGSVPGSAGKGG